MDDRWAPFDRDQNPLLANTLGHLALFQEEVHRQCLGLSVANLQVTPELVELDDMLAIATQFAIAACTPEFKVRSGRASKRTALCKLP